MLDAGELRMDATWYRHRSWTLTDGAGGSPRHDRVPHGCGRDLDDWLPGPGYLLPEFGIGSASSEGSAKRHITSALAHGV